jgi:hypothetical protein
MSLRQALREISYENRPCSLSEKDQELREKIIAKCKEAAHTGVMYAVVEVRLREMSVELCNFFNSQDVIIYPTTNGQSTVFHWA